MNPTVLVRCCVVFGLVAVLSPGVLGQGRGNEPSQPKVAPRQVLPSCLLVDVEGAGLSLSSATDGVLFDVDGDGVSERVAWPKSGSRLGFLAIDVNSNGLIDNGTELIGSALRHPSVTKPTSGITIILLLQGISFGVDGKPYGTDGKLVNQSSSVGKSPALERDDAAFQKLLLWRDLDRNGRSSPYELGRLDADRIIAVLPGAQVVNRVVPGALVRVEGAVDLPEHVSRIMYEVVLDRDPPRK